ncbi:MAG: ACT domain-containing protein [Oscillospiraceae bacterium]|nr:ACT domain-containing protein [Oscillospiraceae bacterium]
MDDNSKFIVVDSTALPDVFKKVLEVKKLMANKGAKSFASACKSIGISRSAYYKYKDSVFSYEEMLVERIVNIYALLKDEPGVLSGLLARLHSLNANILTVNQNIPVDGVAGVNISLKLQGNSSFDINTLNLVAEEKGVVEIKILSAK